MKQFSYRHPKEAELMDSLEKTAKGAVSEEELFTFAEFNEAEVERTGYSNYSYWSSTFLAFLKNRGAVILLVLLLLLLAFTFIPVSYTHLQETRGSAVRNARRINVLFFIEISIPPPFIWRLK